MWMSCRVYGILFSCMDNYMLPSAMTYDIKELKIFPRQYKWYLVLSKQTYHLLDHRWHATCNNKAKNLYMVAETNSCDDVI